MFTLIVGGGLFLLVQSRGYALQHVGSGWRLLFQKENTQGISRFERFRPSWLLPLAWGTFWSSHRYLYGRSWGFTLDVGTAALGTVIKFYSSSLAVMLREKEEDGSPLGGPMYYATGLPKMGKYLGGGFLRWSFWGFTCLYRQSTHPNSNYRSGTRPLFRHRGAQLENTLESFLFSSALGLYWADYKKL